MSFCYTDSELIEELDNLVEQYENGELDFKELLHRISDRKIDDDDTTLWDYVEDNESFFASEMQKQIGTWSKKDFDYAIGPSIDHENWVFVEHHDFMSVVIDRFPSMAEWALLDVTADGLGGRILEEVVEPKIERLEARVAELEERLRELGVDPELTPEEAAEAPAAEFENQVRHDMTRNDNTREGAEETDK